MREDVGITTFRLQLNLHFAGSILGVRSIDYRIIDHERVLTEDYSDAGR